jgi:hypothetical protein
MRSASLLRAKLCNAILEDSLKKCPFGAKQDSPGVGRHLVEVPGELGSLCSARR